MDGFDRPVPDWPCSLGAPAVHARSRVEPDDFQVWEVPLVEPDGAGSHLWLEVRKCNANTQWVAARLAEQAGAPVRDAGYAGMKDRRAVTTQWFSIGLQEAANDDWNRWDIPGVSILRGVRHSRKLQRGALRGNRFRILLRGVRGAVGGLDERLMALADSGLPNYFGPQRFGRDGANAERGARWLVRGGRVKRGQRGIYISAVRSFLFNQVLAERVRRGNWNRLLDGDIAQLDGSRSTFACSLPDPALEQRCADFDIHPTGPLPGDRGDGATGEAGAIERMVLDSHAETIAALQRARVNADRRSLRVVPDEFTWQIEATELLLAFTLPRGAYATALLRELVSDEPGTISEQV